MKTKIHYEESKILENDYFSIRYAHRNNKSPWLIAPHYSNSIEIIIYRRINAHLHLDDQNIPLGNHSMLIIPPYTIHGFEVDCGEHDYYILHLSSDDVSRLFDELRLPSHPQLLQLDLGDTGFIYSLLSQSINHPKGKIKEQAISLFLHWFNHASNKQTASTFISRANSNRFTALLTHLDEKSLYTLSADQAAKLCNVSKSHFFALFKVHFHKTYADFMVARQIAQAKFLLSTTDMSITDIAQVLSFCDASYFTKVFKSKVHLAPKIFRRKHR